MTDFHDTPPFLKHGPSGSVTYFNKHLASMPEYTFTYELPNKFKEKAGAHLHHAVQAQQEYVFSELVREGMNLVSPTAKALKPVDYYDKGIAKLTDIRDSFVEANNRVSVFSGTKVIAYDAPAPRQAAPTAPATVSGKAPPRKAAGEFSL